MADDAGSDSIVPGYKNYLIYTDESGMHRGPYYGFGTLWMPWERRGDFAEQLSAIVARHRFEGEIKWKKVTSYTLPFYTELIDWFMDRRWLMFHCVIVRRGSVDMSKHRDRDQAQQKHFSMLLKNKIRRFARGGRKRYRIRTDVLPWRYSKSGEVVQKIVNAQLCAELGDLPIYDLFARDSKATPGIQLVDTLLGAALAEWQEQAESEAKHKLCRHVASRLDWETLKHDTYKDEWKFNVWYFTPNPSKREAVTRRVTLR